MKKAVTICLLGRIEARQNENENFTKKMEIRIKGKSYFKDKYQIFKLSSNATQLNSYYVFKHFLVVH